MKEVTITLKDETYDKLKTIVNYGNMHILFKRKNKPDNHTIEELIKGATVEVADKCLDYIDRNKPIIEIDDPHKIKVKNRFKQLMKEQGLTQTALAEKVGVSRVNIGRVLNNDVQPQFETLIKYWIALGCPPIEECIEIIEDQD